MEDFRTALSHFTGSTCLYHHPMYREPRYTDGVRYFLQNAGGGAYWLLDLIATEPAIRKQAREFAYIVLEVANKAAKLVVTDGNNSPAVYERVIEYTDCPAGTWKFYWTDDVLMLTSEW